MRFQRVRRLYADKNVRAAYTHDMRVFVPVTFTVALLLTACGDEVDLGSPESAATAWLEAHVNDDQDAVLECVVDAERRAIQQGIERAEQADRELPEFNSNITSFEILGATISGNRAVVNVKVTRDINGEEKQVDEKVVCLKEDKAWQVSQAGTITENRQSRDRDDFQ